MDIFIFCGLAMIGIMVMGNIYEMRIYSVGEEGVIVSELKKYNKKYLWNEISEIAICDVHHATKSEKFEKVIRIVIGIEKDGSSNCKCSINTLSGREKWRSETYEWKHYKQLIIIEYSKENLEEIQQASRMKIKDYRSRDGKRLWKIEKENGRIIPPQS